MTDYFSRWLHVVLRIALYTGVLNFVVFWVVDVVLGGDALNGTIVNGQYYLSQNGRLTEVTGTVYYYSYAHAVSVVVTLPIAIVCGIVLQILSRSRERK
jgi:uncharacterized membrane protein YagU involved in acid resistance